MQQRWKTWLLGGMALLGMAGCRLDDDTGYEIRTYASFLLVQPTGGGLSLYRYSQDAHSLDPAWNATAGVPDADLSDVGMVDNLLWLASGAQKKVLQVNPADGSLVEAFDGLPIAPHFIAVGSDQVMVADTAAHKLAFIKRRNGDVQEVEFTGKPGPCLYNSGKFFLVVDDTQVAVYDEKALSPRATLALGMTVDELLLNKYHVLQVMGRDSTGRRLGIVDVNGDFLVGNATNPVAYTRLRPTPYFVARFGGEYLYDLQWLGGNVVSQNGVTLADSVDGFEADFFEGTLFYQRGASLLVRNMATGVGIDSLGLSGSLRKSFHQYAP